MTLAKRTKSTKNKHKTNTKQTHRSVRPRKLIADLIYVLHILDVWLSWTFIITTEKWVTVWASYLLSLLWVSLTQHQSQHWAHSLPGLQHVLLSVTGKGNNTINEISKQAHYVQCFSIIFKHELFDPDLRHILLLLLFIGVAYQLVNAKVRVGAITETDGCWHSWQLLHHNYMI